MKLISWNVNGLRACAGKGFFDFFKAEDADIFCLGETKMQPDQADFDFAGYHQYWNSAEKKGYSGVAVFTKAEPFTWSTSTPPTPRTSWRAWTTGCSGRTTSAPTSARWIRRNRSSSAAT